MSVADARQMVHDLATAGNLGEDMDRALDVLTLEIRAALPCYRGWHSYCIEPLCESCAARAKLTEMKVQV